MPAAGQGPSRFCIGGSVRAPPGWKRARLPEFRPCVAALRHAEDEDFDVSGLGLHYIIAAIEKVRHDAPQRPLIGAVNASIERERTSMVQVVPFAEDLQHFLQRNVVRFNDEAILGLRDAQLRPGAVDRDGAGKQHCQNGHQARSKLRQTHRS
jgi:hypothetical protein